MLLNVRSALPIVVLVTLSAVCAPLVIVFPEPWTSSVPPLVAVMPGPEVGPEVLTLSFPPVIDTVPPPSDTPVPPPVVVTARPAPLPVPTRLRVVALMASAVAVDVVSDEAVDDPTFTVPALERFIAVVPALDVETFPSDLVPLLDVTF